MTDDLSNDPFAGYQPSGPSSTGEPSSLNEGSPNPFAQFGEPRASSTSGAFARGAEQGAAPAVGGLAGAGGGAFLGGLVGGPPGAFIGGVIGGFGGSFGASKAQDYALKKAPEDWKEKIGLDDRQLQLDQAQHSYASFIGGMAPFVVTMSPFGEVGGAAGKASAEGMTGFERIMANPKLARVFGGAVMGGMEAGQEINNGEAPNWAKVGIATGFGMVFNRPNAIGEKIEGILPRAFGMSLRAPVIPTPKEAEPNLTSFINQETSENLTNVHAAATQEFANEHAVDWEALDLSKLYDSARANDEDVLSRIGPTTAQAGDVGVMGSGLNEATFMRSEEPPREAALSLQDAARNENEMLGKPAADVESTARSMNADLFKQYDDLNAQREAIRSQIASISNPSVTDQLAATTKANELRQELKDLVESRNGYAGGADARRLRAQIRDADAQAADMESRRAAYQAGEGKETPETMALRGQFMQVDAQLRDMGRQVAAARLNAAEALRTKTAPAEPLPPERVAETPPPEPKQKPVSPAKAAKDLAKAAVVPETPAPPRTIEQQRGFIEDDVRNKLTAAGRSPEEAEASAKITSALYETHAERTGRSPEEIYRSESPDITLSARLKRAFGKLTVADGRKIIKLAKDANATTFIHELGHDWLERLVKDADLPTATQSLKDDAAAIKKWIGHTEGEIKTAAHEKFARGFERYLFEGSAPSTKLASVFAKFRNWMTEVYRSIKGAVEPSAINEDIRGVFDRMLTTAPERTTVVPEHVAGPSLADIHEADAAHTNPDEADASADRVAAERERFEHDMPPEVAHELKPFNEATAAPAGTEPGGEDGAGGAGRGEMERVGGDAGPQPQGGGVGGGRGAVGEGGSASAAKGGGVSSGGRAASEHPLAGTAPVTFGRDATFNVGKDGNVRVENITSKEQLVSALNEASERVGGGGPITMGQMIDTANDLEMDPKDITQEHLAKMFGGVKDLASKVWALRQAIVQQTEIVNGLMKNARESGSDQDYGRLAIEIAKHDMMFSVLSSATTESGRSTGMGFRNLEDWSKSKNLNELSRALSGRDLFQLKQMAELGKNLQTPGQVSKFLRDAQKRSFGKMILEFFINNLISGPATHITYTVGNEVLLLNKMGFETPMAAAIGALRAAMGREGERVHIGEAGAMAAEHYRALPKTIQAGIEGLRTGRATLMPGETGRPWSPFAGDTALSPPARTSTNADVSWREAQADAFGLFQGMRDGLISAAKVDPSAPWLQTNMSETGYIPNFQVKGVAVPVGEFVRAPSRMVSAIHSSFRTMNYSIEVNALAWRQATAEGLEGMEHAARTAELRQNPTEAMMEQARVKANDLTLMGQGGEFVKRMSKLMNWTPDLPFLGETPVLKFIDPFVHIAANIIDQTFVHRTPVGLLSESVRADLMGKNGNIAQDMAQARMLVGTAMTMLFGGLAASGYMTGSGPTNPDQNLIWRMAGNQAHSIRIGDVWYDVHRMGPLGMLAGMSADLYDVAHAASQMDLLNAGSMLIHAFSQNVLDESFVKGPANWIQAITDPARYGPRLIQDFASSFVPYSVGLAQIDRTVDPYARATRSVMDAIKQKVPGLSESLYPRRDIWGQPVPNREAMGTMSSIYESRISSDPVNIELANIQAHVSPVPKSIRNVLLTEQQYDDFARLSGVMTKQRFDVIINSPDWKTWPLSSKLDIVAEVLKQSRETARGVMFMKYPQIAADATKVQMAKKGVPEE